MGYQYRSLGFGGQFVRAEKTYNERLTFTKKWRNNTRMRMAAAKAARLHAAREAAEAASQSPKTLTCKCGQVHSRKLTSCQRCRFSLPDGIIDSSRILPPGVPSCNGWFCSECEEPTREPSCAGCGKHGL